MELIKKKQLLFPNNSSQVSLEKFLFTYLQEKHSIKNKVILQAQVIVNAVRYYMKEDALVEFFARCLRH